MAYIPPGDFRTQGFFSSSYMKRTETPVERVAHQALSVLEFSSTVVVSATTRHYLHIAVTSCIHYLLPSLSLSIWYYVVSIPLLGMVVVPAISFIHESIPEIFHDRVASQLVSFLDGCSDDFVPDAISSEKEGAFVSFLQEVRMVNRLNTVHCSKWASIASLLVPDSIKTSVAVALPIALSVWTACILIDSRLLPISSKMESEVRGVFKARAVLQANSDLSSSLHPVVFTVFQQFREKDTLSDNSLSSRCIDPLAIDKMVQGGNFLFWWSMPVPDSRKQDYHTALLEHILPLSHKRAEALPTLSSLLTNFSSLQKFQFLKAALVYYKAAEQDQDNPRPFQSLHKEEVVEMLKGVWREVDAKRGELDLLAKEQLDGFRTDLWLNGEEI